MPSYVIWASERGKGCAPEEDVALYRSAAFVLHTYKLAETDQIVVLFTQEFGKLRAVARRSHSPRRHAASYYQPLMLLNAIVYGRPGQTLYRMHSVDILQALRPLHEDFGLLRCGLYMTELIDVATHEREPAQELFVLFHQSLEQLAQTSDPMLLLRHFELQLLMAIGYTPQLLSCAQCTRDLEVQAHTFSPRLGGLLCTTCASTVRQTLTVSPETLIYLRCALAGDTTVESPTPLAATVQQELERLLHAHLTFCLGRELKSYAFLHL
jgi:DNA repair protein RecO (recombination protein O)